MFGVISFPPRWTDSREGAYLTPLIIVCTLDKLRPVEVRSRWSSERDVFSSV